MKPQIIVVNEAEEYLLARKLLNIIARKIGKYLYFHIDQTTLFLTKKGKYLLYENDVDMSIKAIIFEAKRNVSYFEFCPLFLERPRKHAVQLDIPLFFISRGVPKQGGTSFRARFDVYHSVQEFIFQYKD